MSNTILFIDDNKHTIAAHIRFLELKNYDVIYARTFEEALSFAEEYKNSIGLVILDCMLPLPHEVNLAQEERVAAENGRKAGVVIFEKLRNIKEFPTIVLSARNDIEQLFQGKDVVDILKKPIGAKQLFIRVNKYYETR